MQLEPSANFSDNKPDVHRQQWHAGQLHQTADGEPALEPKYQLLPPRLRPQSISRHHIASRQVLDLHEGVRSYTLVTVVSRSFPLLLTLGCFRRR